MKALSSLALTAMFFSFLSLNTACGSFHLMQIEEIIGGVNGDTSAQAIELRMRSNGQNLLLSGAPNGPAVLRAWDANGANPITLITFDANVANAVTGDTVLITSSNFASDVTPGFSGSLRSSTNRDFTLANIIPASYLSAGKLTYEESNGTILWSLAWGGTNYKGSTGGASGFNGVADPGKFGGAVPSTGLDALLYNGAATGTNSDDATDYSFTSGAALFDNNAGTQFTVVPEPDAVALLSSCSALWVAYQLKKRARN